MDINTVLTAILICVFIIVGVALVVFLIQLVKVMKSTNTLIVNAEPTLKNVETITTDVQPAINKIEPLMDRVQLTLDSVNLEMMRVDQILEDVAEITDTASSATAAVDNITNAPVKAINNVATRVKTRFGGTSASQESVRLAEQRVAVGQALKEYEEAEAKENPPEQLDEPQEPAVKTAASPVLDPAVVASIAAIGARGESNSEVAAESVADAAVNGGGEPLKSYVKYEEGAELEIDPKVIAESPFFSDDAE